jgi:hypothetical protein
MADDDWCVAVFRCKPADVRRVLISLYGFVKDLEGVKSLHFITRDRLKDDVVFSFRVLVEDLSLEGPSREFNARIDDLKRLERQADRQEQDQLQAWNLDAGWSVCGGPRHGRSS